MQIRAGFSKLYRRSVGGHLDARTGSQVFLAWCVLLVCSYAVLLTGALVSFPLGGSGDFLVVYSAAKILRDGNGARLYDLGLQADVQHELIRPYNYTLARGPLPYIHPPFFAAFFVPFTFFSLKTGFYLWDAISLAVLLTCIGILGRRVMTGSENRLPSAFLVVLAYYPVLETLRKGQSSFLLLAAITMTYIGLKQGRCITAGLGLASAFMKPQIAFLFAVLLLCKRRWRPFLVFIIGVMILAVASWLLVGFQGLASYANMMRQAVRWEGIHHVFPETMPNLRGTACRASALLPAGMQAGPSELAALAVPVVSLAIIAMILHTWRGTWDPGSSRFDLWFTQTILASIVISPYVYWHDLALLILAGFLTYGYSRLPGLGGMARYILVAGHICAVPLSFVFVSNIGASAQILVLFILGAMLYVHREARKDIQEISS